MKKRDKQILDLLGQEFKNSAETANVPLKLQKESIVNMLQSEERKEKDFSDKTGTKNNKSIIALRRITAAAAMLTIVVIGVLAMKMQGVKVIKTDSFYESYKSSDTVKNAKSYSEVEQAVREILSEKAAQTPSTNVSGTQPNTAQPTGSTAAAEKTTGLLNGYESFVAAEISISDAAAIYSAGYSFNNTNGVSYFDGFEADIVKNDGEFLYIVATGKNSETGKTVEQIKIVKAVPAENMETVSTVTLSEYSGTESVNECLEIYLKNDILIALVNRNNSATAALYYDISEPENPVKIREHVQDGKYVSSGLHESKLYLVTDKEIISANGGAGLIPSFSVDGATVNLGAEDIFIAVNDPDASYIFITVTDIYNLTLPVGHLAILGSGKQLYCSANTVTAAREFVSVDADDSGARKSLTEIYRFNLNGTSLELAGSYVVEGSLVGGLSIDENGEYLRIASASGDSNNIYILDRNMNFVSGLKKIFSGEKISGVKFIGDNGYITAGGKTMTVDLSDPLKLNFAGMVSSVDFPDNLYTVSESTLLGVNVKNGSVTLSLFDVSNSDNPKVLSEYTLDSAYRMLSHGDSRSVVIISDKNMFGIPVAVNNKETQSEASAYMLFKVENGKIIPYQTFIHDDAYVGDAAVRSTCIDGVLYTVSGEKVTAFSVDTGLAVSTKYIK